MASNQKHRANVLAAISALVLLTVTAVLPFAHPAFASSPTIDGYAATDCAPTNGIGSAKCQGSNALTTSSSNDVIYVCAGDDGTSTKETISDGSSLTWHLRVAMNASLGGAASLDCWYAIAPSPLSSDSISIGFNAGGSDSLTEIAFGISGADTASPFDPGVSSPPVGSGSSSSTPESVSMTTTDSNDILVGFIQNKGINTGGVYLNAESTSAGSGYTLIAQTPTSTFGAAEYQVVSSAETGFALDFAAYGFSTQYQMIGDAIVGASAVPVFPMGIAPLLVLVPLLYVVLSGKLRIRGRLASRGAAS